MRINVDVDEQTLSTIERMIDEKGTRSTVRQLSEFNEEEVEERKRHWHNFW